MKGGGYGGSRVESGSVRGLEWGKRLIDIWKFGGMWG